MSTQRDLHFRLQITPTVAVTKSAVLNPGQSLVNERKTNFKSPGNLGYVRETSEFVASWDRKELYVFEIVSIRLLQNVGYPLLFISESIDWFSHNLWKSPTNNHTDSILRTIKCTCNVDPHAWKGKDNIKYRYEEIQHHHSKLHQFFWGLQAPNFRVQIFGEKPRMWNELNSELKTMSIDNETFQFHS